GLWPCPGPPRRPHEEIGPGHESIAAPPQAVFEEAVFHVLRDLHARTGLPRLCLAGGAAMNSVANGKIRAETPFREVFVQPASADSGTALGAALLVPDRGPRRRFVMEHAAWGPEFGPGAIRRAVDAARAALDARGAAVHEAGDDDDLCRETAERLADGWIVGWFQGRMEWGARALGQRSILADPRRADMRETINAKIKLRE